jgi:hypothetical protein
MVNNLKENLKNLKLDSENIECVVCLEEIIDISERPKVVCNHNQFHQKCLEEWLKINPQCPVCQKINQSKF